MSAKVILAKEKGCSLPASMRDMRYGRICYISAIEMKGVARNMEINGRTRITGLFGYPVEHTLSPAMHNAAFGALGLNYCYVPFRVHPDSLASAVQGVRAMNLAGVNVTVPHKENVIPFLDEVSEEASFIGAVNTIVQTREGSQGTTRTEEGLCSHWPKKAFQWKERTLSSSAQAELQGR